MKKEKKITFLIQRITELEKENTALKCENQTLSKQLDDNKSAILSRQAILDEREKQIENTKLAYEKSVDELKELREAYQEALMIVKVAKKKYDSESTKLLKRLRKED